MRAATFLTFFLLALLSVISFAGAESLSAGSLTARDLTDVDPTPGEDQHTVDGGLGKSNDNDKDHKRVCPVGTGLCPNDPGYCCPLGGRCCGGAKCCKAGYFCYRSVCCINGGAGCGTVRWLWMFVCELTCADLTACRDAASVG
jgi:hypothetical protein